MKDKVLLITVFQTFITKNILNTEVFSILKLQPKWRIVLAVPHDKIDFFKQVYGDDRVTVVGVDMNHLSLYPTVKFFSRLFFLLQDSHYLYYKKKERLDKNKTIYGYLKFVFEVSFTKIFKHTSLLYPFYRWLFLAFVHLRSVANLFDQYGISAVFLTDIFSEADSLFAVEAKRRGLSLIGMVRSWDNCYSKGILRVLPDEIIVNNDTLRKSVVSMHKMDPKHIFVGGLPQFDHFVNENRTSREKFFRNLNLDPSKRLIVFAPAGTVLSDTDWQIGEILDRAINSGGFKQPVQVLVRNHPNHPADFSGWSVSNNFIIENPGKTFNKNPKETEITKEDSVHLADTLYYADVVIYVATTLGLDALVFNKPQIILDFDGKEVKDYYHSVRRYHDEDHMKEMISCGGVRVVSSAEEMIKSINDYLEDQSLDQSGRDKMLIQQLYKIDGQSGQRIGNFILKKLP